MRVRILVMERHRDAVARQLTDRFARRDVVITRVAPIHGVNSLLMLPISRFMHVAVSMHVIVHCAPDVIVESRAPSC